VIPSTPSRRELFAAAAALGIGSITFHRAVAVEALAGPAGPVTAEMVKNAEWVAGIELTEDQRKQVAAAMTRSLVDFAAMHKVDVPNSVPPAIYFLPDVSPPRVNVPVRPEVEPPLIRFGPPEADEIRPGKDDDLAFLPLAKLANLVRNKKLSSAELTKLALARFKQYDPALKCVVSLTEELALKQAAAADKEIAAGKYRGPLHGIPWAAKDLIAYPGYKTTWGAGHFQEQAFTEKATVAARLDAAGAVLTAKVSLGSLALNDEWFGGKTRNPWNVKQGSSGSSAGSAASVAAGLVPFALGSETQGSILSPCTRCGATGLRPTFGRVSRHGCMALAWSMDKIGPIARSVEDCALVFSAIHGADGKDLTAVTRPFAWPCPKPLAELRVGYTGKEMEGREELKVLKDLGVKLVPIALPTKLLLPALQIVLTVESAAAFDNVTLQGVSEGLGYWPPTFRRGRFIPAVEYLRAQRIRTMLMKEMAEVMQQVDLYVGGNDLVLCNMTGHPTVVIPNGKPPEAITFTGRLYGESELLAAAQAYQEATGHHLKHPDMSKVTKELADGK
jgi:Asp-tRNA(Asn)/Glu-tRNA(Gln) amidotransferase A subunit family amidase